MSPVLPDTRIWSWDEYAALPDDPLHQYQVLDGEVFVSPSPGRPHQGILTVLIYRLYAYVREHELGEVLPGINLVLGPGGYVVPDLVFLPKARMHGAGGPPQGPPDLWIEIAPALIIEILSPSTRGYDRVKKRRAYEEFGADEYWIVDPDARQVEVYRWATAPAGTAVEPEIHRDRVLWQPATELAPLEIALDELWER